MKETSVRPSPNEEMRLIREENERRRKLRIQQVREQQRYIALQIRRDVERRRQRELEQLEEQLRADWERQQREKLRTLQELYQESLQLLGQGHRSAKENEPDLAAMARMEEENHSKAEQRYQEALKELKLQRLQDQERHIRSINARKKALQAEKERSARVASLPPPPPNPIQNIYSKKQHVVKKSDVSAYAATHYHMPDSTVDREVDSEQPDAHEGAELELRRLQDLEKEQRRRREEQLEKARLRGKQALRREHLLQDRERLLVELEHMQQTDLLRRRQQVSQIPPQIFQPLYKRQEAREDFQREMEFAFEDMYTGERRVKGDLVVQLVPEPLPALSTGSQDQELDVTLEETSTTGNAQQVTERETGGSEQETSAEAETSRPAPRRALKKLLDRIRNQRNQGNQWTDHSSHVLPADSPSAVNDQIPERDTTMDTGSLTSEDKLSSAELPEPAPPPAVLKTPEQSAAADILLPVQRFEDERKKREEELEREKQQQVVLLQELEEQKAKLEQMLTEAQQEREHLKAVVTDEVSVDHTEEPVHDQEVTSVSPDPAAELVAPAGEADHTRRIREYQQRLLEQNRLHQRSVEVARQRLEEYQRALRIRYNMTAVPLGLLRPPLHRAQSLPPYLPATAQTSVEVPTRDCHMLASPPRRLGSKMLSDAVESVSNDLRNQRPDNKMTEEPEDLPVRMRPSSVTAELPTHKLFTTHQHSAEPMFEPVNHAPPLLTHHAPPLLTNHAPPLLTHHAPPLLTHHAPPLLHQSLCSREDHLERLRGELQEVEQRRELQEVEQREDVALQQKEERQRQEVKEQLRQQEETLQALIAADEHSLPEAADEVLASENVAQTRLKLLVSLLRAIEETNGGTLSHLEDPQEKHQQHGESAPVCQRNAPAGPPPATLLPPASLLPPPRAAKPPVTRIRLGDVEMTEQHELSVIQEVETPVDTSQVTGLEGSVKFPSGSAGWDVQESSHESESSRGQHTDEEPNSSRSSLLVWRETSLESSESDSVLRMISPPSSNSGRGANCSGPAVSSYRSPTESALRPPDVDGLSSTSISTGSYVTTDVEFNAAEEPSDKCPPLTAQRGGAGPLVAPPPGPAEAAESLFDDSSIQRIIDRYTRELNISLSTTGKTSDSDGSGVEEAACSVSQQCLVEESQTVEDRSSAGRRLHSSEPQRSARDSVSPAGPAPFSGEAPSLAEEQDSFRPLIGQLTESSCLDDRRDSVLERLVGQPSAHSSMIDQLRPPVSASWDGRGWDSTLSRMIGRLSHQTSSHWLSGGQDFYAGQLLGDASERSATWLDDAPEESRMRPLVGELDESVGQQSESSGENAHLALRLSAGVLSYPALPPEAGVSPGQRDQTSSMDPREETEGFDSFHPLLAEVTHNETAEPSVTFDLPERDEPSSPEGQPGGGGGRSVSTPEESEPSPERPRTEEPFRTAAPPLQESFSQLLTSQCPPPEASHVELTALSLSHLTVCDDAPARVSESPEESAPFRDEELKSSDPPDAPTVCQRLLDAAGEKGILEQSAITLVSLTDSLQETTVTEEDQQEGQKQAERSESSMSPEDKNQTHPATLLEFQWGSSRGLREVDQQRRSALQHRSSRRVEEIKTRRALAKTAPEAREQSESASVTCKTESQPPRTSTKSKGGRAEKPALTKQKTLPPAVSDCRQKKVDELKICTVEQRKRAVSEMHQRTRRLYEQLEEVKQQRDVRIRQETCAENRLKAKEFHKKTLQKLRAKQSLQ